MRKCCSINTASKRLIAASPFQTISAAPVVSELSAVQNFHKLVLDAVIEAPYLDEDARMIVQDILLDAFLGALPPEESTPTSSRLDWIEDRRLASVA